MRICFATNNRGKLNEIRELVPSSVEILSLLDIGCTDDLPENQKTLEGNSLEKAQYVASHFQVDCFADDTGLEVYSLDGEPGVLSARYAGPSKSSSDNMDLLLRKLDGVVERGCQFRTVITFIHRGRVSQFEGVVQGTISASRAGAEGFGYDPIFVPKGFDRTFGEMSMAEKNAISHRSKAVVKLVNHLKALAAVNG